MNVMTEIIRGKHHAVFKHGNQKFVIHTDTGLREDAIYLVEMLKKNFSKCPRCASDVTEKDGWRFCQCGASW